jgi:hypothetical protein
MDTRHFHSTTKIATPVANNSSLLSLFQPDNFLSTNAFTRSLYPGILPAYAAGYSYCGNIPSYLRIDLTQAMIRLACTQERIAQLDLERAKVFQQ